MSPPAESNLLLAAALDYAARGRRVLPLHHIVNGECSCKEGAGCEHPGKHPCIKTGRGHAAATTNAAQIRQWWDWFPKANIGPAPGPESGFFVLDCDPRHGGDETLASLEAEHGQLPDGPQVLTGGGGTHRYLAWPADGVENATIGPGLEVKAAGSIVNAPPSTHISGRGYEWELSSGMDTPLPQAPGWLLQLAREKRATPATRRELPAAGEPIKDGERNVRLFQIGCALRRQGATAEEIAYTLVFVNHHRCKPALDDDELNRIIESAARYESLPVKTTRAAAVQHTSPQGYSLADLRDKPIRPTRWLLERTIRQGVTVLASKPHKGKSWMLLDWALAASGGGKAFSGEVEIAHGPVLLVALQDSEQNMKERCEALLAPDEPWPQDCEVWHTCPPLNKGGEDAIRAWLQAHPAAALVGLDIWPIIRPPRGRHEDIYAFDVRETNRLHQIGEDFETTIVAVMHLNKNQSDDLQDLVQGSYGISGIAECTAVLTGPPRSPQAELHIYSRHAPGRELAIEFQGGRWTIMGDAAEVKRSAERQAVLQVLQQANNPLSIGDIALTLGWEKGRARVLCWRMASAGDIRSHGKATYSAFEHTPYSTTVVAARNPEIPEIPEIPETAEMLKRVSGVSPISGVPDTPETGALR